MVSLPPIKSPETQEPRPSVQHTHSGPPTPQIPPEANSEAHMSVLPLKKRPSTLTLPNPLTPISPPLLSPASKSDYNVSRIMPGAFDGTSPIPQNSSSRPSTASSREEVTPWEYQPSPLETTPISPIDDKFEKTPAPNLKTKTSSIKSKPSSIKSAHQPSLRSRMSGTATGLVEDVTPWELYPPIPEMNTRYHHPTQTIPEYTPPLDSPPPVTATGFVEDVTPWELVPLPPLPLHFQEHPVKSSPRSPSYLIPVDETSTLPFNDSSSHLNRKQPSPAPLSINHSRISGTSSQEHKVTKTGPTEDVTPWELEPGPSPATLEDSEETRTSRLRTSLTLAQVEAVTPWELYPAPPSPSLDDNAKATAIGPSTIKKKISGNSFASNNGKALSDLSFARTRKHGAIKHPKSRNTTDSHPPTKPPHSPVQYVSVPTPQDQVGDHGEEMPRHVHSRISQLPPTPRGAIQPPAPVTATLPTPVASNVSVTSKLVPSEPSSRSQFNMSTADRKILTQLEFFRDAHDKEFIIKGKGYHQHGGGVTPGKIHHAYDEKKAPYPRSYDGRAQDLDVWEMMIYHQTCDSWTWHVFKEPPKVVLDVGCGTGSWITHVARAWKECHFWGIDLVPTQPDFTTLGDRDLKERIHWVHNNFLEGLPFENEKFDYVHIKRVGLGVPEDKWDILFEECKRVLKPGGAFELIEEDLFFPGKPNDFNELSPSFLTALEEEYEVSSTAYSNSSASRAISPITTLGTSSPVSTHSSSPERFSATPTTNQTSFIPTPSPSEASAPDSEPVQPAPSANAIKHDIETSSSSHTAISLDSSQAGHVPFVLPHSRSVARPNLSIKTPSSSHSGTSFGHSAVSLLHSLGHSTPMSENISSASRRKPSNVTGLTKDSHPRGRRSRTNSSHETRSQASTEGHQAQNDKPTRKRESYLLRQYKAPLNPRDHTILETIYAEMLASRFINTSPLSIIQNYLEYHFIDVRTHPPLLYTFPPTALLHSESRYVTDSETETESSDGFSSDDEEARDAIRPNPPKRKDLEELPGASDVPRSRYRCTLGKSTEDEPSGPRYLSFPHLIRRQSPYVSFDGSRGYAFSPSIHSSRRSVDGQPSGPMRMSRLPNPTLNIDIKTLNMHLYLRTMDILGCSEPMWEWVAQYQSDLAKKLHNDTAKRVAAPGGVVRPTQSETSLNSTSSANSNESVMDGIAEMTRDDFEILLVNFELDMQDQASVDYALQEQVNWHVFASPRDFRRKAFDDSCKKWDKWVAKQERRARHFARHLPRTARDNEVTLQEHSNGSFSVHTDDPNISHSADLNGIRLSAKQDAPAPVPFSSSSLPPHKRLSRALRVFVAWKPQDPRSPNQAVPTYNGLDTPL